MEFCHPDKDLGVITGSRECIRPIFEDLKNQFINKFIEDKTLEAYRDLQLLSNFPKLNDLLVRASDSGHLYFSTPNITEGEKEEKLNEFFNLEMVTQILGDINQLQNL